MTHATTLLSLSGAQLRAMGTPEATTELARRAAKREASGHWTVAAAKSQGRDDIAATLLTRTTTKVPAKPAKAAKVAPAPVAAPVVKFNRANLTVRMNAVEESLLSLAALAASQNKALTLICAKLGVEA